MDIAPDPRNYTSPVKLANLKKIGRQVILMQYMQARQDAVGQFFILQNHQRAHLRAFYQ